MHSCWRNLIVEELDVSDILKAKRGGKIRPASSLPDSVLLQVDIFSRLSMISVPEVQIQETLRPETSDESWLIARAS